MSNLDIVRAWKDPNYRRGLSPAERALLPPHPAGTIELTDAQLKASDSMVAMPITTAITCTEWTFHGWHACCPPATTAPNCTLWTFHGWHACCPPTIDH